MVQGAPPRHHRRRAGLAQRDTHRPLQPSGFGFPWPDSTPCTWLTTLSRDDLIERAGDVSTGKLGEIDDTLRASEQRMEWTPAAAARLSAIRDSLRRRTQADGEATDATLTKAGLVRATGSPRRLSNKITIDRCSNRLFPRADPCGICI
jgi:hypothetical protein